MNWVILNTSEIHKMKLHAVALEACSTLDIMLGDRYAIL